MICRKPIPVPPFTYILARTLAVDELVEVLEVECLVPMIAHSVGDF